MHLVSKQKGAISGHNAFFATTVLQRIVPGNKPVKLSILIIVILSSLLALLGSFAH